MLKFAGIYGEKKEVPPKEFFLKLESAADGSTINLIAVDKDGEKIVCGYLLRFTKCHNGTMKVASYTGISDEIGIALKDDNVLDIGVHL
jgi:hypothetical protein